MSGIILENEFRLGSKNTVSESGINMFHTDIVRGNDHRAVVKNYNNETADMELFTARGVSGIIPFIYDEPTYVSAIYEIDTTTGVLNETIIDGVIESYRHRILNPSNLIFDYSGDIPEYINFNGFSIKDNLNGTKTILSADNRGHNALINLDGSITFDEYTLDENNFTAYWCVTPNEIGSQEGIFGTNQNRGLQLRQMADGELRVYYSNTSGNLAQCPHTSDVWKFTPHEPVIIAIRYSLADTSIEVYINGDLCNVFTGTIGVPSTNQHVMNGVNISGTISFPYSGVIHDYRTYTETQTATQVKNISLDILAHHSNFNIEV